jgi:hypothetical protein
MRPGLEKEELNRPDKGIHGKIPQWNTIDNI